MDITKETIIQAIADDPNLADVLTTENRDEFADYALKGAQLDLKQAIRLMIDGYIDNCGISAGGRTLYYDAGQALLEKFLQTDDLLAVSLKAGGKEWFGDCMEAFNELYAKEEYGEYDITILRWPIYLDLCIEECGCNLPEAMKAALCYGIYLMYNNQY